MPFSTQSTPDDLAMRSALSARFVFANPGYSCSSCWLSGRLRLFSWISIAQAYLRKSVSRACCSTWSVSD
mgnify:CR=1 FL=1